MNTQINEVWDALRAIYGSNLQAATVTMLLKDGDNAVNFVSVIVPKRDSNE